MKLRTFVLTTHRWLGLSVSIIVAVAGGTGSIMVWGGGHFFRRAAGKLHVDLAMGRPGGLVVLVATAAAILLELGGLYLWWSQKKLSIRRRSGWRNVVLDLHHVIGVLGFAVMLALAVTALGMSMGSHATREALAPFHTGRSFPVPAKLILALCSLGFVVQAGTGILMWMRRQPRSG